jgi:hypothetical protein
MTVVGAPASVDRTDWVGGERVVCRRVVKSDIRGLVTAGRTVLLEWIAGLEIERNQAVLQHDCS